MAAPLFDTLLGRVSRLQTFRALQRHRNFRLLWVGLLVSNAGTWMQSVAQGWLVLKLSSPFYLGLVGLVRALPLILFSLVGGAFADLIDRRRLLYATQTVQALMALVLGVLTALGVVQVWHVLLLAFFSAAALAFDQPTRQSLVPQLVSREDLYNAYAMNSIAFQGATLLGPTLAGALIPFIGLAGCFFLNALSFAAVIIALALMQMPSGPAARRAHSVWDDLTAGLREARRDRRILALLLIVACTSLFGRGYNAFLPVFAELLGVGVRGLGILTAAVGVGTVVASLAVASLSSLRRPGPLIILGALAFGGFLAVYAWSPYFWLTFGGLALVGGLNTAIMSTNNTFIQLITRDEVRGRVMSLFTLAAMATMPLGQAPMGWWMEQVGPRLAVSTGAALVVVGVSAVALLLPQLWRGESHREVQHG